MTSRLYMKQRIRRPVSRWMIAFAGVFGLSSGMAAHAACYAPAARMPADQIQSFLKEPGALLSSNAHGGGGLVAGTLKLVASDSAALPAIIQLLQQANVQQRTAIGAGLASAVQACLGTDQAFAGEIQSQLAASNDRLALTAFVSGGGQGTATAATGAPSAPGATAYVSATSQSTGSSAINNTPAPGGQSFIGSAGNNFLTYSPSSTAPATRFSAASTVSP